ncbi:MAG TPA: hypothetical protein VHA35_00180 [Dongiaceae bacterium]|nr:hypothetical protein [Dongiaceae bacterium]
MNTCALNLIDNGNATGGAYVWNGGKGSFLVHADTWNGATVKLQVLGPDHLTWIDTGTDTTLTADGGGNFELPPGQLRAAVVGSPTAVYAVAAGTQ